MSQKKTDFFKKANVQINKTNQNVIDDTNLVEFGRDILNTQINDGDEITDIEMVSSIVDTSLDWYAGDGDVNDMIVNIHKGDWAIRQPLDSENQGLRNINGFSPVSNSRTDILGWFTNFREVSSAIEYNGYIVFGSDYGFISSYHIANKTWHTTFSNNGGIVFREQVGSPPTRLVEYNGWLVCSNAYNVLSYHPDHGWTDPEGNHPDGDQGPHVNFSVISTSSIYDFKVYDGILFAGLHYGGVICSNGGQFNKYDGTNNPNNLPYNNKEVTGGYSIFSMEIYNGELIFASQHGRIGSYNSSTELWTNYDGTGGGSGFHDNQYLLGSNDINSIKVYDNKLIIAGEDGKLATHDAFGDDTTYEGLPTPINYYLNTELTYSINSTEIYNDELLLLDGYGVSSFNLSKEFTKSDGSVGTGFHEYFYQNNFTGTSGGMLAALALYNNSSEIVFCANDGSVFSYDGSEYKNADGSGIGTGPYIKGLEGYSNEFIRKSIFYDNKIIYVSEDGNISFFSYVSQSWVPYTSSHPLCVKPLGERIEEGGKDVVSSISIFNDTLVFSGQSGRISSWDGTAWKYWDGSGSGSGIFYDKLFINEERIGSSVVYDGSIAFAIDTAIVGGGISSWDGTNWKYWDGSGTGTGPYASYLDLGRSMSNMIEWDNSLIIIAEKYVSSFDGTAWKYWDGSGTGTGPYANFNGTSAYSKANIFLIYKTFLIVAGQYSIHSYDGTNWKYADGSGTGTGPYTYIWSDPIYINYVYNNKLYYNSYDGGKYRAFMYDDNGGWTTDNIINEYPLFRPEYYTIGNNNDLIINDNSNNEEIITIVDETDYISVWKNNNLNSSNAFFPGLFLDTDTIGVGKGETISSACNYGDYIVMANGAEITSYHKTNKTYHTVRSNNGGIVNYITVSGGSGIFNLTTFGNFLMASCSYGRISSFDGTEWKYYDGTGTGTGPYNSGTVLNGEYAYAATVYDNKYVLLSYTTSRVASFDGTAWKNSDGSGTGTGPYSDGLPLNYNRSYSRGITSNGTMLVIASSNGNIASFDGTAWKNYDGSGTGTGPYNNGTNLNFGYNLYYMSTGDLLVNHNDLISSFDGINWKYWDGSGAGNGLFLNNSSLADSTPFDIFEYDGNLFIISSYGSTSSYSLTNGNWCFYDGATSGEGAETPNVYRPLLKSSTVVKAIVLNDQVVYISSFSSFMNYSASNEWTTADQETGYGIFEEKLFDRDATFSTEEIIIDAIEYDSKLIVLTESGRVSYFDFLNNQWTSFSQNILPARNKNILGGFGERIYGLHLEVFNDQLIFAGSGEKTLATNISNYSKNTGVLSKYDGTEGTQEPYLESTSIVNVRSTCIYSYNGNDYLILSTNGGISSWDGTAWKYYNGTGTGTGPYASGTNIGSSVEKIFQYKDNLIAVNYLYGDVSSFDGTEWKYFSGSGIGTGPYYTDVFPSGKYCYSGTEYGDFLVLGTNTGEIASFDGTEWKFHDGTGTGTGPYSDGTMDSLQITQFEEYNGYLLVITSGSLYSYDGINWNHADDENLTGLGPAFNFEYGTSPKKTIIRDDAIYLIGTSESVQTYDLNNNAKNEKVFDNALSKYIYQKAIIYE